MLHFVTHEKILNLQDELQIISENKKDVSEAERREHGILFQKIKLLFDRVERRFKRMICEKCNKETSEEERRVKIVSRNDPEKVLFQSSKETIKEAVEEAAQKGVDLSSANLSNVDLSNADLSNADLSNANLSYVNLSNADLSSANLSNANLFNADLSNADLSYVNLFNADLSSANLSNADLSNAKTTMCAVNFSSAEYEQAKQFIEGLK